MIIAFVLNVKQDLSCTSLNVLPLVQLIITQLQVTEIAKDVALVVIYVQIQIIVQNVILASN